MIWILCAGQWDGEYSFSYELLSGHLCQYIKWSQPSPTGMLFRLFIFHRCRRRRHRCLPLLKLLYSWHSILLHIGILGLIPDYVRNICVVYAPRTVWASTSKWQQNTMLHTCSIGIYRSKLRTILFIVLKHLYTMGGVCVCVCVCIPALVYVVPVLGIYVL